MTKQAPTPQPVIPQRLKNAKLPVLPPGAPYLIRTLAEPEIGMHDVAELVERFPSIAMRLISLANSAWSAPASAIHSLLAACSRLGMDVVRSVSIALTVAAPFDPRRCPGFDVERYWTSALLCADAAYLLTEVLASTEQPDPQAMRTAGLLHNIGLVWMASQMPQEMASALAEKLSQPDLSLSQLLQSNTGLDYATAGAYLATAWKLPDSIVQSIQHHANNDYQGDQRQTVCLVRYAQAMVSILLDGEEGDRQVRKLEYLQTGEIGTLTTAVFDELRKRMTRTQALAKELFSGR